MMHWAQVPKITTTCWPIRQHNGRLKNKIVPGSGKKANCSEWHHACHEGEELNINNIINNIENEKSTSKLSNADLRRRSNCIC